MIWLVYGNWHFTKNYDDQRCRKQALFCCTLIFHHSCFLTVLPNTLALWFFLFSGKILQIIPPYSFKITLQIHLLYSFLKLFISLESNWIIMAPQKLLLPRQSKPMSLSVLFQHHFSVACETLHAVTVL